MKITRTISGISVGLITGLLSATTASAATIVGTELLLSVDVSGSVNSTEFELQREGYAQSFESANVINAIENSNGVAVGLSYWASEDDTLEIDWTLLNTAADSLAFANTIRNEPRTTTEGNLTDIDDAINFGVDSILNNGFTGSNLVIDVSGDGTSSISEVQAARDAAVAAGVTVNGLAINSSFSTSIEDFYRDNVIGGPNSFVEAVSNFADVSVAAERKIAREIISGGGGGPTPDPDTAKTPEPASVLSLFALGALGMMKRKKSS